MAWLHTHLNANLSRPDRALVKQARQSLGLFNEDEGFLVDEALATPLKTILAYDHALKACLPNVPYSLSLHLSPPTADWVSPEIDIHGPFIHWTENEAEPTVGNPQDLGNDFHDTAAWPLNIQWIRQINGQKLYGETLLRSRHGDEDFDTGLFIAHLEDQDEITTLDHKVLARVCAALEANDELHLGVNISRKSLIDPLTKSLLNRLAPAHLRGRLVLEITESAMLTQAENQRLHTITHDLAAQGFQFALDDMGKGAPTIRELINLPLTYVKIDQGLSARLIAQLQDPETQHAAQSLLQDLLQIGDQHGWTLIAEGLEAKAHLNLLSMHGVQAFQGFAVERPQPCPY